MKHELLLKSEILIFNLYQINQNAIFLNFIFAEISAKSHLNYKWHVFRELNL